MIRAACWRTARSASASPSTSGAHYGWQAGDFCSSPPSCYRSHRAHLGDRADPGAGGHRVLNGDEVGGGRQVRFHRLYSGRGQGVVPFDTRFTGIVDIEPYHFE